MLQQEDFGKYFEAFYSVNMHVLIRFGRWEEILQLPPPPGAPEVFQFSQCIFHYSRGVALSVVGQADSARQELLQLLSSTGRVAADRVFHNNSCRSLLQIAALMLRGEVDYREGGGAFPSLLMQAVSLSDRLVYDEPWGWMQPPRHALGALLLLSGRAEDAIVHFRKDVDTNFFGRCHPNNIWAIKGIVMCLKQIRKGSCCEGGEEGEGEEERELEAKLHGLLEVADKDINLFAACLCATPNNNSNVMGSSS